MKRRIEIDVEFDDNFKPPDKFDLWYCSGCPFFQEGHLSEWCSIEGDDLCPIKQFFKEG